MQQFKTLEDCLQFHLHKYPVMELSDAVKLIYQNEFGGGHLIADPAASLFHMEKEMEQLDANPQMELFEAIGNTMCRIYLPALQRCFASSTIAVRSINRLFIESATLQKGSLQQFKEKLQLLQHICKTEFLTVGDKHWTKNQPQIADFLKNYAEEGYPVMSHSRIYNKTYAPAYRVIANEFAQYISLFQKAESLLGEKKAIRIGIDGRCGAGKTTLARLLQDVFDCNMIHMDDFFLPPDLRTSERLQEPGGNIHYERFYEEVILALKKGGSFAYRVFDCSAMQYKDTPCIITPKPITIVEGSYCMHPKFAASYDLRIFLDISDDRQKNRIINRNGIERYADFQKKWIPMENKYFDTFRISDDCDEYFIC